MFYLFVKFLESFDDRINPITIRDLRRLRRRYYMEVFAVLTVLAMIPFFLHCYYADTDFGSPSDRSEAAMLLTLIPAWLSSMFLLLTVGWPIFSLVNARSTDELLELVPLSPGKQVRAYLLTSTLLVGFLAALLVPFYVAAWLTESVSPWLLLVPPGFFLYGILCMILCLSFVARAKQVWEVIVLFFVINYFGVLAIEIPGIVTFFLWGLVFQWPGPEESVPLMIALGVLCVPALFSYALLGYWLSVNQFGRRRLNPWQGAGESTLAYVALTVAWCVVVLAVSGFYFGFVDPFLYGAYRTR